MLTSSPDLSTDASFDAQIDPAGEPAAPHASRTARWMLIALVVLAAIRLLGFVRAFGEESLQMDFSAFYTAGEALNAGLSPYENHIDRVSPRRGGAVPLWDGVDRYRHSRFLYPPLVATLFRPVALLPYRAAKVAWMLLNLAALALALCLAMRLAGVRWRDSAAWATWLGALCFHPLLTYLERGQIDSIILLLLTLGIVLIVTRRREALAGGLFALATLLKLHTVLVLPFLVVRRRWRPLAGYAAGGFLILLASLILDGPAMLWQYATVEFPRISTFGEGGTQEMLLDPTVLAPYQPGAGLTVKDGQVYSREYFSFVSNASLGRTGFGLWLRESLAAAGVHGAQSVAALVVFAGFFGVVASLQWRGVIPASTDPGHRFLYWQLVLVIVLLSAPLTWVMNTVWLLPLLPFVLRRQSPRQSWPRSLALGVIVIGLTIAAVPDHLTYLLLVPRTAIGQALTQKYVYAEILIALGLVGMLVRGHRAPLGAAR